MILIRLRLRNYCSLQRAALWIRRYAGGLLPGSWKKRLYWWLFPKGHFMELLIDVVGTCNLRCPSCPQGNTGQINPTNLIDKDLLEKVIDKAARDFPIEWVFLYNWGEPFLHPKLSELIRIVKRYPKLKCGISTNLNLLRNIDDVLLAAPHEFRISLSGFTQEVYGQTHARGKIEKVKENMRLLRDAKVRTGNRSTRVVVYFHKYRHNLHEIEPMRDYALSLGFDWMENWAYYMPVEKALDLAEGRLSSTELGFVREQFALPIEAAIEAALPYKNEPCRLLKDQIVLDLRGNLLLCCGVFDFSKNSLGSFLDMTPESFRQAKKHHPTCTSCASNGLHRYLEYYSHPQLAPLYDQMATDNVKKASAAQRRLHMLPVVSEPGPH